MRNAAYEITEFGCPPELYIARENEKAVLDSVLSDLDKSGKALMISGRRGFGKTSYLNWAQFYIEREKDAPAVLVRLSETKEINFDKYSSLVHDIKTYKPTSKIQEILRNDRAKFLYRAIGGGLTGIADLVGGPQSAAMKALGAILEVLGEKGSQLNETEIRVKLRAALYQIGAALLNGKNNECRFLAILIDDVQWLRDADLNILKELIEDIPKGVAIIITFSKQKGLYDTDKDVCDRHNTLHDIFNHGAQISNERYLWLDLNKQLEKDEIRQLTKKYNYVENSLKIEKNVLDCLYEIGVPFDIVCALNYLWKEKSLISATDDILKKANTQAKKAGETVYNNLDKELRILAKNLCLLAPKARTISMIRCMMADINIDEIDITKTGIFEEFKTESCSYFQFSFGQLEDYTKTQLKKDPTLCTDLAKRLLHKCLGKCGQDVDAETKDLLVCELSSLAGDHSTSLKANLERSLDAAKYYETVSLAHAEQAGLSAYELKDHPLLTWTYFYRGQLFRRLHRMDEAVNAFDNGFESAKMIEDIPQRVCATYGIGRAFQGIEMNEKARDAFDFGFDSAQRISDPSLRADAMYGLGRAFQGIRMLDKADRAFDESTASADMVEDPHLRANMMIDLSRAFQGIKMPVKADRALEDSYRSAQIIADFSLQAHDMLRLGLAYQEILEFKKAELIFDKSFESIQKIGDPMLKVGAMRMLNSAFRGIQEFEKADHVIDEALGSAQEISDPITKANAIYGVATAFFGAYKFESAKNCLSQVNTIAEGIGDFALKSQVISDLDNAKRVAQKFVMEEKKILAEKQFLDASDLSAGSRINIIPGKFEQSAVSYLSGKQVDYGQNFGDTYYDLQDRQAPKNVFSYETDESNPIDLIYADHSHPNFFLNIHKQGEYESVASRQAGCIGAFSGNPLIKATFGNTDIAVGINKYRIGDYRFAANGLHF